jgi:hypothetical protein
LVGKPEGKRPLGRPRHRWKGIRMYVRESKNFKTGKIIICNARNWKQFVLARKKLLQIGKRLYLCEGKDTLRTVMETMKHGSPTTGHCNS